MLFQDLPRRASSLTRRCRQGVEPCGHICVCDICAATVSGERCTTHGAFRLPLPRVTVLERLAACSGPSGTVRLPVAPCMVSTRVIMIAHLPMMGPGYSASRVT